MHFRPQSSIQYSQSILHREFLYSSAEQAMYACPFTVRSPNYRHCMGEAFATVFNLCTVGSAPPLQDPDTQLPYMDDMLHNQRSDRNGLMDEYQVLSTSCSTFADAARSDVAHMKPCSFGFILLLIPLEDRQYESMNSSSARSHLISSPSSVAREYIEDATR